MQNKKSDEDQWEDLPQSYGAAPNATELLQLSYYCKGDELVASAPPLIPSRDPQRNSSQDILKMDPPDWLPDSLAPNCGLCQKSFQAMVRSRHHCRMCGRIFCHQCCSKKLLLPPNFIEREPQRICQICAPMLSPFQAYLAGCITKAARAPVYDVMDSSALRSWINNPVGLTLEGDIYKVTNIIHQLIKTNCLQGEIGPPTSVLKDAAGFAILSYVKVGAGWSYAIGTGLLVARKNNQEWSPPCSIGCVKLGSGLQAGVEVVDMLLVIRTKSALATFCGPIEFGLGGSISLSMGPLGRSGSASVIFGQKGGTAVYSYSLTKGFFAGISMEGTVFAPRQSSNENFYGQSLSPRELIFENITGRPRACSQLYMALDTLVSTSQEMVQTQEFLQSPYLNMQQLPESEAQQQYTHYPNIGMHTEYQENEIERSYQGNGSYACTGDQDLRNFLEIGVPSQTQQMQIQNGNDPQQQLLQSVKNLQTVDLQVDDQYMNSQSIRSTQDNFFTTSLIERNIQEASSVQDNVNVSLKGSQMEYCKDDDDDDLQRQEDGESEGQSDRDSAEFNLF